MDQPLTRKKESTRHITDLLQKVPIRIPHIDTPNLPHGPCPLYYLRALKYLQGYQHQRM